MSRGAVVLALISSASLTVAASGPIGYYGIIEKVVFEPAEKDAERVQVWGAFAYVDLDSSSGGATSSAERGYLYFRVRSDVAGLTSAKQIELNRREWADLKSVAGTGQVVGFGKWGYIGDFGGLHPRALMGPQGYVHEITKGPTDMRVRPASEPPANPATYQTQAGVVKINDTGSHAAIVAKLREALKRR